MRGKMLIGAAVGAVALTLCGAAVGPPSQSFAPRVGTVDSAQAAVAKSTGGGGGGGGNANAAGQRFGNWLSDNAVPVLIAFAGCALISVLFSRNIGAGVGI